MLKYCFVKIAKQEFLHYADPYVLFIDLDVEVPVHPGLLMEEA